MNYAQMNSRYYCGIDLHARQMYVCVMDAAGNVLLHRNMRNDFDFFKPYIKPFLPDLAVGVESGCYYYWLADACHAAGIPFYLGHALYMKAISGAKVKNDRIDSRKIADLMRANLFPLAYPYPREMRATRDLLRRRHDYVARRAGAYTHIQQVFVQHGQLAIDLKQVKDKGSRQELIRRFENEDLQLMIASDLDEIVALDAIIERLEKRIIARAKQHDPGSFQTLLGIPGVGTILGLIILYETHDIARFPSVQRYSSYCGVVKCDRSSSGKKLPGKHYKVRNPYLKWAFGEIIMKATVASEPIKRLYERMQSKYGPRRAKSIIAHRFAVATYFMLKNRQTFDVERFVKQ